MFFMSVIKNLCKEGRVTEAQDMFDFIIHIGCPSFPDGWIMPTPSVPNYKSFQESRRVKVFQILPNLYDKIITFMILIKYH